MKKVTYNQAVSMIETGDTIGIQTLTRAGRIIEPLQKWAGLRNHWATHCVIAVWLDEQLWALEMSASGNILKKMDQYEGKRMLVCHAPADARMGEWRSVFADIASTHIPYSIGDFLRIGTRLVMNPIFDTFGWGGEGRGDKVCSILPAMVYSDMGADISNVPALASPAECVNWLRIRCEVVA